MNLTKNTVHIGATVRVDFDPYDNFTPVIVRAGRHSSTFFTALDTGEVGLENPYVLTPSEMEKLEELASTAEHYEAIFRNVET